MMAILTIIRDFGVEGFLVGSWFGRNFIWSLCPINNADRERMTRCDFSSTQMAELRKETWLK